MDFSHTTKLLCVFGLFGWLFVWLVFLFSWFGGVFCCCFWGVWGDFYWVFFVCLCVFLCSSGLIFLVFKWASLQPWVALLCEEAGRVQRAPHPSETPASEYVSVCICTYNRTRNVFLHLGWFMSHCLLPLWSPLWWIRSMAVSRYHIRTYCQVRSSFARSISWFSSREINSC